MILKAILVGLLSTFEIYVAIATGMAAKLSVHTIFISTLIGGIVGVLAAVFLGNQINKMISKFKKPKVVDENKAPGLKEKIVTILQNKFGSFGVGFIGTFLVGGPISMGIGLTLGIAPKKIMWYCLAAVAIRSFVYSYFFDFIKNLF